MYRWLPLFAMLVSEIVLANGQEPFDFTCTDGKTLFRVADFRENVDQPAPCRVKMIQHPIGDDNLDWQMLWRVDSHPTFCSDKILGLVEKQRAKGWTCAETEGPLG